MTTRRLIRYVILLVTTWAALAADAQTQPANRIGIRLNTSEAETVLAIADKQNAGKPVTDADWNALLATEPYVRLKKREAGLHRDFTDDDFKKFVLSPNTTGKAAELRRALDEWSKADMKAIAARILPYLPAEATVRAKVFVLIKPQTNSFVYEVETDPTIFLYLDPQMSRAAFETVVAHEMHHIGFASTDKQYEAKIASLPEGPRQAAEWMGAFGEGAAMLAAAGGSGNDPVATYKPGLRAEWKQDMANFGQDFRRLEQFFVDVADRRITKPEEIRERGMEFFGSIGPWYSVGYRMGALVEQTYGRAALVRCMEDPRSLLATYNKIAAQENARGGGEQLPLWSPDLLTKVAAVAAQ